MRYATGAGLLITAALLTTACTATPASTPPPSPVTPTTNTSARPATLATGDWPTYHRDNARTGSAPDLAPLGTLAVAWHAALDGAVYGQPLVVGGKILAATEHDTLYALDPATGAVRWSTHVGE